MKPITLILQPSIKLTVILVIAGVFFGALLLLVSMPFLVVILFLLVVLLATIYFVMRDGLLTLPWSWKKVELNKAGEWRFTQNNGLSLTYNIANDSFVSEYLTVLHLLPAHYRWFKFWQHRYVLLLQYNTEADFFRKLRVSLLWGKLTVDVQSKVIEEGE